MAIIGVNGRLGSIGPSAFPTIGYSNGFFVIESPWGEANSTKICSSLSSFLRQFGGLNKMVTLAADGSADTWSTEADAGVVQGYYAIKGFFDNRGANANGVAYVVRVIETGGGAPTAASRTFTDGAANLTTVTAKWKGDAGETITVEWTASPLTTAALTYKRAIVTFSQAGMVEVYDIATAADASSASAQSELVTIALPAGGQLPSTASAAKLGNGTLATADPYTATSTMMVGTTSAAGVRTGIQCFNEPRYGTGFVCAPNFFDATIRAGIKTHCETYYRFGLLGAASGKTLSTAASEFSVASNFCAGYVPQIRVASDVSGTLLVDPVGHVAGLGARMDAEYRGPHKSPTGIDHEMRGCLDVELASNGQEIFDDSGSNTLADSNVNTIRRKGRGAATVVWGCRTFATDSRYRQINAARVIHLIYLTSFLILERLTFEPIDYDGKLFARAKGDIGVLLAELYRNGALYGSKPAADSKATDAYAVQCDHGNNPASTIIQNILVVDVMACPAPNVEQVQLTIFNVAPGSIPSGLPK